MPDGPSTPTPPRNKTHPEATAIGGDVGLACPPSAFKNESHGRNKRGIPHVVSYHLYCHTQMPKRVHSPRASGVQYVCLHSARMRNVRGEIWLSIGFAVRADFRRLYPANAKTPTCCPSDDNRTKVKNSVTSARSLWWHVGPYFWPADLTRTANPIPTDLENVVVNANGPCCNHAAVCLSMTAHARKWANVNNSSGS